MLTVIDAVSVSSEKILAASANDIPIRESANASGGILLAEMQGILCVFV